MKGYKQLISCLPLLFDQPQLGVKLLRLRSLLHREARGVPISISVSSAVLFTTLSSIQLSLGAAASLYSLRQPVK